MTSDVSPDTTYSATNRDSGKCRNPNRPNIDDSLLLLLLVPVGDVVGELVELLAVVGLDLCPAPEDVLHLRHHRLLRLQPPVKALQLLVQLHPDVCNAKKERENELDDNECA